MAETHQEMGNRLARQYNESVFARTGELKDLLGIGERHKPKEFSALYNQYYPAFRVPLGTGFDILYQWVWWHPESADFWIETLGVLKENTDE